jgi:ABC-type Fe3+ transport system permease subunit
VIERLRARFSAFVADPALGVSVLVLWLLLLLFVLFPLGMLFARIGQGEGGFSLKVIGAVLFDQHQIRALGNSLLLGTLVGICGTVLGFLFAFTVSRARLHPTAVAILDAAILLPLVSPPFTTRGLFFSAITRASASPEEKRTKFTLMPEAFSNSSNIGRAQFSGQIE